MLLWCWPPSIPSCAFPSLLCLAQAFIWVSRRLVQGIKPAKNWVQEALNWGYRTALCTWPYSPQLPLTWVLVLLQSGSELVRPAENEECVFMCFINRMKKVPDLNCSSGPIAHCCPPCSAAAVCGTILMQVTEWDLIGLLKLGSVPMIPFIISSLM